MAYELKEIPPPAHGGAPEEAASTIEGAAREVCLERQTYTIEEAARILGICRTLAYRKGVLPTVRVAGRRLVPKRALERMLAETA